jgi:hypothetical protein
MAVIITIALLDLDHLLFIYMHLWLLVASLMVLDRNGVLDGALGVLSFHISPLLSQFAFPIDNDSRWHETINLFHERTRMCNVYTY